MGDSQHRGSLMVMKHGTVTRLAVAAIASGEDRRRLCSAAFLDGEARGSAADILICRRASGAPMRTFALLPSGHNAPLDERATYPARSATRFELPAHSWITVERCRPYPGHVTSASGAFVAGRGARRHREFRCRRRIRPRAVRKYRIWKSFLFPSQVPYPE